MFNPLITATAGWSAAVEERSRRLLAFVAGTDSAGAPVTLGRLLHEHRIDPVNCARGLMILPPLAAVRELTRMLARLRLEGEACPDAGGLARAALAFAGRAVTPADLHPEWQLLAGLLALLLPASSGRGRGGGG